MKNKQGKRFGDFRDYFESEEQFTEFRDLYDELHELPEDMWLEAPFESFLQAAFQIYHRDYVMLPSQLSGAEAIPMCVFRLMMGEKLAQAILN